jgi:hypothetical protein
MEGERESLFESVTRVLRDPDPHAELARLSWAARRAIVAEIGLDETVRVVIRGTAGQAIVGTDTQVLVLPPFVPGTAPAEAASWPYLDVLGVELNERVVGGSVVLRATDGRAAVGIAGDRDAIRARVAMLRGLVAGAHTEAVPAELRLVAL